MIQVTNIQDLKTAVNQNGEMVITMNNNDIVIMKMELSQRKAESIIPLSIPSMQSITVHLSLH